MVNKLYPFEKNRYYPGKMLSSADFQAEQNYLVNKSRFMNQVIPNKQEPYIRKG